MEKIKLSVIIISYAQEKYIREAIESVLNQKVDFKYELLLADDCSPDNTKKIMKEYEKKYPDIIKILNRTHNLGGANNYFDACSKAKGKYITVLEGDDYWCNNNKLQIQVDFLENNPDYYAISHLQEGRDLKNEIKGYFPKNIRKNTIVDGVKDFINKQKIFSCSSTMYKNFFKEKELVKMYKKLNQLDPIIGDAQTTLFLCSLGKVYILNEPMMVYRMRNNDGNSNFNSTHKINDIEYRFMNIYVNIEKIYNNKYSMYKKIKNNYTLGVAYNICKLNFKDIKRFNELCPKKYKWRIILIFPFTCVKILFNRFIKK